MPFIPPEQLARTREMDLLTYLRCCEPDELVSAGGNTYASRSHDRGSFPLEGRVQSIKISIHKDCGA